MALQALKEEEPEAWSRIGAVAVTTQRDTVVPVDADGVPVRPAIIWLDQRMARCDKPMPLVDRLQFKSHRDDPGCRDHADAGQRQLDGGERT